MTLIGANKSVMGFNLVYLIDDVEFLRNAYQEILDMKVSGVYVCPTELTRCRVWGVSESLRDSIG